jgi:uncharacterized protein (DUF2147 family)
MKANEARRGRFGTAHFCTVVAILTIALGSVAPSAAGGEALVGRWLTAPDPEGRSHVEIVERDGEFEGRIVWLEKPLYTGDDPEEPVDSPKLDRNNPEADLRDRPILGLELLSGFTAAGPGQWQGGTIYDPTNGKTYKCKLRLEGDTLHVRGYIGISLIGRTTEWTRVPDS